jgi:D-apiose dehydrogenase
MRNMNGQVRKGVLVGAGYFSQFHAEAWQRMDGVHISAVVDSQIDKAQSLADRFDIPAAFASQAQALEQVHPDFVDIVTRPETHLELTTVAAGHNVHVLCQKPMAPTWQQCLKMCDVCDQHQVRLLIHENWRWQPWYREIHSVLKRGDLGRLVQITFLWRTGDGHGSEPYATQPYFRQMPRLLVYETLVHLLDTFRYLGGEICRVGCWNRRLNPFIIGEDQSLIQVQFEDGTLGVIDANRHSGPHPAPPAMGTMLVEGDRATLRLSPNGRLWLAASGSAEKPLSFQPPTTGYKGDSVYATQAHLLECLSNGQVCESEGREYLKTMRLVEACYQSAETGRIVEIPAGGTAVL